MDLPSELHALTLLVEILDAGNLSEAARRLKMSRANVSYHLNAYEKALGQLLVRRTTRRIEATEIGLKLYAHGRQILNELEAARDTISHLGQGLQGRVRLSVPSGYGQLVMAPWLIDFQGQHPGIVLDVAFENRVIDFLRDEVDIALRVMSEPPDHLVARDLGEVRYVACVAPAFEATAGVPDTLDALSTLPVLTSGVVGRQLRLTAHLHGERHEVLLRPRLMSENFAYLREAILAGLGVGVVPDYVVADAVADGRIRTILNDWRLSIFGSRMFMLYMPNRHHTRAASALMGFILQQVQGQTQGLKAAG
jgi:DNA-binding transcriptional LysR family regulator